MTLQKADSILECLDDVVELHIMHRFTALQLAKLSAVSQKLRSTVERLTGLWERERSRMGWGLNEASRQGFAMRANTRQEV